MSRDETLRQSGVILPDVLLPAASVDLGSWAVVACDQYTSQPEYWQAVDQQVGDAPSTVRLIYPEVFLSEDNPQARIDTINTTMESYLAADVLESHPQTAVLVRRMTAAGAVRWGLLVALDVEQYSPDASAATLIRATEGTILDRIPPRKRVRAAAPLELPHIMVLLSDPDRSVIEPLADALETTTPAYDTELMLGGGHVTGWLVNDPSMLDGFTAALDRLRTSLDPSDPLLFAMGDGNHSFATAKSHWDDLKQTLTPAERETHPARFALVELENIFDPGLEFEPIHRVLFATSRDAFEVELGRHCGGYGWEPALDADDVTQLVAQATEQSFGYCDADGFAVYRLQEPDASIAAGTVQHVIDALVAAGHEVDYTHGTGVTADLGRRPGNLGIFLPAIDKDSFFDSIRADGALPRKTFSLGEAADKRYYLEARRIR